MYAEVVDIISPIFNVLGELARLARTLFTNGVHFIALILVLLSRWFAWKDALVNVTPKTFIGWHRAGFRLFWRWKSRPGRPRIPPELRALIRAMARDNPGWGEERIANELLLNEARASSLTAYGTKVHAQTPAGTTARRSTMVDLCSQPCGSDCGL